MDENKIYEIVRILMDAEDNLTDGYHFYGSPNVPEKLRLIAISILKSLG